MAVDDVFEELVKLYQNSSRVCKKIMAIVDFKFSDDDIILLKKIHKQLFYSYNIIEDILQKYENDTGEKQ